MKKHATTILLFVVMFVGLGLLLYPSIADWWNSFHQSRAIAAYTNTVEMESGTDYTEYWEAARAYNERLAKKNIVTRLSTAGQDHRISSQCLSIGCFDGVSALISGNLCNGTAAVHLKIQPLQRLQQHVQHHAGLFAVRIHPAFVFLLTKQA